MISERAKELGRHDPFLVKAHFACAADPFDPVSNPNGYVNFGTAENLILYDLVGPLLRESQEIIEADTHYSELHGAAFFRRAVAEFLGRRAGRSLSPDNIAIASGATGILEILSFVLCDRDDAILIPAPYYTGFDYDLALRFEATLYHIPLEGPRFELTIPAIERAYHDAVSRGIRVRAILINSPQNPLGKVYSETLIRDITAFAEAKQIHIILDEIYAESLMPGVTHFSGLRLESDLIHMVYGFGKDFGLSGYKVGILHSENPEVVKVAQDSAYFYSVSAQTQRTLTILLSHSRLDGFLRRMRERLVKAYELTRDDLVNHGVGSLPVEGGIVMWLDLRRYLPSTSVEGERELFDAIFEKCRVNISPGQAFHCSEPGWFRLCFTVPGPQRAEGLRRLAAYLTPA